MDNVIQRISRKYIYVIFLLLLLLLPIQYAYGLVKVEKMSFRLIYPCGGTGSVCEPYILADGIIEDNSVEDLDKYLKTQKTSLKSKICFNSIGGDLVGALKLGEYIRENQIDTCLLKEYKEVVFYDDSESKYGSRKEIETIVQEPICASACIFAFVGGVNREVDNINGRTRLGVHQFYSIDKEITGGLDEGSTQAITAMLSLYLDSMGIDRRMLDYAELTPVNEIVFLPSKIAKEYRLDTTKAPLSEWDIAITEDDQIYGLVIQKHPKTQARTKLALFKQDKEAKLAIFYYCESQLRNTEEVLEGLNDMVHSFELIIDEEVISKYEIPKWFSQEKNVVFTVVDISSQTVEKMKEGEILKFKIDIPNALRDINPGTDISLKGFRKVYFALFN